MTPIIGDVVYCTLPFSPDFTAIAKIASTDGVRLLVVIVHSDTQSSNSGTWGCSLERVIRNFGQTNLAAIRQNYPELFI